MTVDSTYELAQPAAAYGAVYGRDQKGQNKRYAALAIYVVAFVALVGTAAWSFITDSVLLQEFHEETSVAGLCVGFAILFGVVGVFGFVNGMLSYNQDVYATDIYAGRIKYAYTVFKDWLENAYGMNISKDDALWLLDGETVRVWRKNSEGRVEHLRTHFEYTPSFAKFSAFGRYPHAEYAVDDSIPDVSEVEFRLMVVEKPAAPRVYEWV